MKHRILIEFEADKLPDDFTDQVAGRVYMMPCVKKVECTATLLNLETVPDNMQKWKCMDGATAWHLIERHADGWADVDKMMDEWLEANQKGRP